MSKWKRTVPMMPPMAVPVWTPTRMSMSTLRSSLMACTSPIMPSAMAPTRRAASAGLPLASPKAPQQTMYASPIVLTLCTPYPSASPSNFANRSDRRPRTKSADRSLESLVKPTMSACSTVTSSYLCATCVDPDAMSRTMGAGRVLRRSRCTPSRRATLTSSSSSSSLCLEKLSRFCASAMQARHMQARLTTASWIATEARRRPGCGKARSSASRAASSDQKVSVACLACRCGTRVAYPSRCISTSSTCLLLELCSTSAAVIRNPSHQSRARNMALSVAG
mmetsp:Transcript_19501/g.64448  ORF Transcript_19501/g.64448 Transcript_19501/m.64448 type:complete len:280 (-) Transcript_19501:681-1520(-)